MQRERPADNERRGNRDNSEKKKDEDKDKNKQPD